MTNDHVCCWRRHLMTRKVWIAIWSQRSLRSKLALVPFVNKSSHRTSSPHRADPQLKVYCINSLRAKAPRVGPVYGRASEKLAAGGPRMDVPALCDSRPRAASPGAEKSTAAPSCLLLGASVAALPATIGDPCHVIFTTLSPCEKCPVGGQAGIEKQRVTQHFVKIQVDSANNRSQTAKQWPLEALARAKSSGFEALIC